MTVFKVNADRPALEFQPEGVKWEYDVIEIKLEMERLDKLHGLVEETGARRLPTTAYLKDFQSALEKLGIPRCNLDLAIRLHQLVGVQFNQLTRSIVEQVAGMKGD